MNGLCIKFSNLSQLSPIGAKNHATRKITLSSLNYPYSGLIAGGFS